MNQQKCRAGVGNQSAAGNGLRGQSSSLYSVYHDSRNGSTPIMRQDGKVVGQVIGSTFTKRVKSSVHFLRKPPAIAFDTSTLLTAERAGAVWVSVEDMDTGRTYRASIHAVLQKGFTFNRGYGSQVALPLDRWASDGEPAGEQLAFALGV